MNDVGSPFIYHALKERIKQGSQFIKINKNYIFKFLFVQNW